MGFKCIIDGYITKQTNAKIAVYNCPIDITSKIETKVCIQEITIIKPT